MALIYSNNKRRMNRLHKEHAALNKQLDDNTNVSDILDKKISEISRQIRLETLSKFLGSFIHNELYKRYYYFKEYDIERDRVNTVEINYSDKEIYNSIKFSSEYAGNVVDLCNTSVIISKEEFNNRLNEMVAKITGAYNG